MAVASLRRARLFAIFQGDGLPPTDGVLRHLCAAMLALADPEPCSRRRVFPPGIIGNRLVRATGGFLAFGPLQHNKPVQHGRIAIASATCRQYDIPITHRDYPPDELCAQLALWLLWVESGRYGSERPTHVGA